MKNKTKLSSNEIELVDFRINELRDGDIYQGIYGINVVKVQEIVQMPSDIIELPASADYILGIFDLRGTVIPLVDLAKWIGISETELNIPSKSKRVIISEFSNLKIGFVVHEVKLIRRINWGSVETATFSSNTSNVERGKITGTTHLGGGITLLILDLESIIEDLDLYNDFDLNKNNLDVKKLKKFKGSALVVDDSVTARELTKKNLKVLGFDVLETGDGISALELLESLYGLHGKNLNKFLKLIVSDVEMPVMDGFHFVQTLKNDHRYQNIPVVFNSSICDKHSEKKGIDIGANAYLIKFDTNVFCEEIARIMSATEDRSN